MAVEQELVEIKAQLAQLVQVSQQQATNISRLQETSEQQRLSIEQQRLTIERLTSAFTEQARAITSLSQTVSRLVDAAQRAAQASEAAAVVAQSNQNAIRDLIEELRQGR